MATKKETKFTKEQLLKSKQFCDKQDLLSAVLTDGKEYSPDEAEELIQKYLNRKVN